MNYTTLVIGWILYFALHSVLAAESVKSGIESAVGKGFRYYRLFYSTVSIVGLVALLVVNSNIPAEHFFESSGVIRYFSLLLTTFGVMLIQISFRVYRLRSFIGFAEEESKLRRSGVLDWIRHPIYAGLILVILGFFLFIPNLPTLLSCACMLIYLPIGIYLEEKKMVKAFGQAYLDYRKEIPAIIPNISKFRNA